MDFPRLVYKSASEHVLVENEAEHSVALKAGWHDSVPAANAAKRAPVAIAAKGNVPPVAAMETPPAPVSTPAKGKRKAVADLAPAQVKKNPWD